MKLSGNFGDDASRLERELTAEVARDGNDALSDHLHTCGAIPELFGHDSSEEKLYSKYTDAVLALTFRRFGIDCVVLKERADAADVEGVCQGFSFVADAKAFRLSRTAKNQKDFKIEAMHGWKRGKDFAVVVCPIYQLPARSSQIYRQASTRGVCVLSYSHLVFLLRLADVAGTDMAQIMFGNVLAIVGKMNPSQDATNYWLSVNREMLLGQKTSLALWETEKGIALEAMQFSKEEGLVHLAEERQKVLSLSREDAIKALLHVHKFDSRMVTIARVADNGLLDLE